MNASNAPRSGLRETARFIITFLVIILSALGIAWIVDALVSAAWLPGELFGTIP
jgi:hypothetical protein